MLLHDLVTRQAEQRAARTAIVHAGNTLTFGDLETQSDRLAHLLAEQGCVKGDRVCLFLPKRPRAVVGMLGTLKAGGAYVPIDLASPAQRVERILRVCEPKFALVTKEGAKLFQDSCAAAGITPRAIVLEDDDQGLDGALTFADVLAAPTTRPDPGLSDGDLAHVLFTSGSTGVPKGVMITHKNVVSYVEWAADYLGTQPGDRASGHPPLHFDLSTYDIYGNLGWGAELHMIGPELSLIAAKLAKYIREQELDQWFSVPSILTYMAKFDVVKSNDFPAMKRLMWCGEVLPTPTLIYFMKRLPHVTFTNLYGPTEATIASSYYTVPSCPEDERSDIPIGKACAGEELLVLDESQKPTPVGEIGHLYIRGVGLSPGYWQDEEKTAAAFQPNPNLEGDRIYRTGDLARMGEDGNVIFLGREDSQIKSRGYRIELGEIETALSALDYLKESAVVGVPTGGFEGTAICCGYAPAEGREITPPEIREALVGALPKYMLPARWKEFDALPKNANGKIDRRKIRELFAGESS